MPYSAEYKLLHKDEIYKKNRERYHKNKEKYNKPRYDSYRSGGSYYKYGIITGWKRSGIKCYDTEETFEKYKNTSNCELCKKEFVEIGGKSKHNKKVLDHDHRSGIPRFVCCYTCNCFLRGRDNRLAEVHLELYRFFHRLK